MRIYIAIIILLVLTSCSSTNKEPDQEKPDSSANQVTLTEEQVRTGGLEYGFVQKKNMSAELVVNGLADVPPQNIVSVSFPMGGYLSSTRLIPGMHIQKGSVIAVMADPSLIQLQQDYLIAKTKLEYLDKEFRRQQLLNEHQVNAEKIFQQSAADYQSQRVSVKALSEKLKLIGINPDKLEERTISRTVPLLSPISGYVSKVNVNTGKYVSPSDVLFELIDPSAMHAMLTVFEKDVAGVAAGQKVKVVLVDQPGKTYSARVQFITRNVDEHRAALVHCDFDQYPQKLLPGMFLKGTIYAAGTELNAVPDEAVVRFGPDEFIVEDLGNRRYSLTKITTGTRSNGWVAVHSDKHLVDGKKIVVKNAYAVMAVLRSSEMGQ